LKSHVRELKTVAVELHSSAAQVRPKSFK